MSSLPDALRSYAALGLDSTERLKRLEADFGMRVGKTALAKLNKQFGVPTPRPRASSLSSTGAAPAPFDNSTMNSTISSKSHKAANRISFICDELSSEKPTRSPSRRSENTYKRKVEPENHHPSRRPSDLEHLHTRPTNKLDPTPVPAPARKRWWYAQHADLKLELNEMMTGFALEVLKRHKMTDQSKVVPSVKRASTVRRPFGELSRPITVGN